MSTIGYRRLFSVHYVSSVPSISLQRDLKHKSSAVDALEDAEGSQRGEGRRAAVGDEDERHAGDGEEAAHHADIHEDMHGEVDGDAGREQPSEGVFGDGGDLEAEINQGVV